MRSAVKKAIAERMREGLPVYVWEDGKVVDLTARKNGRKARAKSKAAVRRKKSRSKS